jgi:hypothetical protein
VNDLIWGNAQQMAKEHPETFKAPDLAELHTKLNVGDFLKVCVNGERFWTEVRAFDDEHIVGLVANELTHAPFAFREKLNYKFEHVYKFYPAEGPFVNSEEDNLEGLCPECNMQ